MSAALLLRLAALLLVAVSVSARHVWHAPANDKGVTCNANQLRALSAYQKSLETFYTGDESAGRETELLQKTHTPDVVGWFAGQRVEGHQQVQDVMVQFRAIVDSFTFVTLNPRCSGQTVEFDWVGLVERTDVCSLSITGRTTLVLDMHSRISMFIDMASPLDMHHCFDKCTTPQEKLDAQAQEGHEEL